MSQLQELALTIEGKAGTGQEDVEEMTRLLADELHELDVQSVKRARGSSAPPGAKGLDAVAVGQLMVDVLPTVLPVVVATLQSWMKRTSSTSVTVELNGDKLTLEQATAEQQDRVVAAFLDKHSRPA